MRKKWTIRRAVEEDSGSLRSCMDLAYAGYAKRMKGKRLPPMDIDYSSEIRNYPTWVAVCECSVVGGLTMTFGDEHASIANIAVSPEFQGQGLGRALIELAERKAKEKSYSELHLATHVLLQENISLYEYFGWEETNRDDSKVHMKKEI